jgi:2-polyprenyl-3-methyl-5-hydroxy-6-metoxy-1,4-benzoquinol methylase
MEYSERLKKCPLCKSGHFLNFKEVIDHAISKEKFYLCHCADCKLVFTNPRPGKENVDKYYESENYISHQNKTNNLTDLLYKSVRKITLKRKLNWLNEYNKNKGNLLDMGCGTGSFLKKAKDDGWQVTGIEPNATARKSAKSKKLNVHSKLKKIDPSKQFQAITLFHVLEHIHDLRKTGKKISALLKDEGTLFVAVPNINSKDSKIYDNMWAALDVPRHLYHFTPETMQVFAEEMGLIIVDKKPMKFDSYYISLLSEQYKNPKSIGIKKYIKGVINGSISNLWAWKNDLNYSSILFILKKK